MGKEEKRKASAANPPVTPAKSAISATWEKDMERLVRGEHSDPFAVLGAHWIEQDAKHFLAIRDSRARRLQAAERGRSSERLWPADSLQRWKRPRDLRSVCLSARAHRVRPVSFRGRHPLPEVRKTGRARARSCRRARRAFRRVGAQCAARKRRGQLQLLGWPRASHAPPRLQWNLGAVHSRPE